MKNIKVPFIVYALLISTAFFIHSYFEDKNETRRFDTIYHMGYCEALKRTAEELDKWNMSLTHEECGVGDVGRVSIY